MDYSFQERAKQLVEEKERIIRREGASYETKIAELTQTHQESLAKLKH